MPLGDELDVVALQRRVVVVGEQDALAAHRVARREPRAQRGVGHARPRGSGARSRAAELQEARLDDEAEREELARAVLRGRARAAGATGARRKRSRSSARMARSGLGMIHGGVRWKTWRRPDLGRDRGHDLDGARARCR